MAGAMTGKVALVTGAGMGIGRAVALAFAEQGADVVVADVSEPAGKETVQLIEKVGSKGLFLPCNVSKGEEVKAMIEATLGTFGRLDYACNNAGIHGPAPELPLPELDEELWKRILEVNLNGVMLCMKYEVPPMLKQRSGVIVNIASMAGIRHEPGSYAYTASKHGVVGLTKVAAFAYAKEGIRVNAICPAVVETPMFQMATPEFMDMMKSLHPVGRVGKPEEIAAAVIWLCGDLSAFVTGTSVIMDGGISAM
ncbi:MAG: 2,5-dichloro-2,5-cyclohexadiene-1,4-diol dehydrogenase [Syntrophorhabdus sp. PtaU1.Bin153]|nr:MAG: 2,5-dichloro-2,5-cyclohexadiene-1,4-diol dehydrogenase [Syntrophorhabdus sp. PtaU1.Bin153]